ERGYDHQVLLLDFDGPRLAEARGLNSPRDVPFIRLPGEGTESLARVIELLEALPALDEDRPAWQRPFLEVAVHLTGPEPTLRGQVETALERKAARLVRLTVRRQGDARSLADASPEVDLATIDAEHVFRRRFAQKLGGDPPDSLLAAFHDLLGEVTGDDA
ncbi:MAG: exonuclease SbcCD subunit D C-terminal domain-containing protein, partial [Myxococcales bacterium]|nr:exonuclease SbcCD subunit D C-terminal domain-containing protein [Myxococcales bacterium]